VPDLIAISQGLSAAKTLTDLAKIMMGLRDSAKLRETTIEFQQQILSIQKALLDAQGEQTTLIERIRDLEEEVARFKAWETEKQRYELVALAPNVIAMTPKETMRGSEPQHYLCANCYNAGKKSYLQMRPTSGYNKYTCNSCKEELSVPTSVIPSRSALPPERGPSGQGGPQEWMGR
jgi:hypothetical protein